MKITDSVSLGNTIRSQRKELKYTQGYISEITGSDYKDGIFAYDESYISDKAHHSISISLPLSGKPFSAESTRTYFEGLLPEGFTRKSIADSICRFCSKQLYCKTKSCSIKQHRYK